MTPQQLLHEKGKHDDTIDQIKEDFAKHQKKFIEEHSPVEVGKVYYSPDKTKGYTRFVPYTQGLIFFDKNTFAIRAGGWWLDKNNVPAKWHTTLVWGHGIGAREWHLSEDQTREEHPESQKAKDQ